MATGIPEAFKSDKATLETALGYACRPDIPVWPLLFTSQHASNASAAFRQSTIAQISSLRLELNPEDLTTPGFRHSFDRLANHRRSI